MRPCGETVCGSWGARTCLPCLGVACGCLRQLHGLSAAGRGGFLRPTLSLGLFITSQCLPSAMHTGIAARMGPSAGLERRQPPPAPWSCITHLLSMPLVTGMGGGQAEEACFSPSLTSWAAMQAVEPLSHVLLGGSASAIRECKREMSTSPSCLHPPGGWPSPTRPTPIGVGAFPLSYQQETLHVIGPDLVDVADHRPLKHRPDPLPLHLEPRQDQGLDHLQDTEEASRREGLSPRQPTRAFPACPGHPGATHIVPQFSQPSDGSIARGPRRLLVHPALGRERGSGRAGRGSCKGRPPHPAPPSRHLGEGLGDT